MDTAKTYKIISGIFGIFLLIGSLGGTLPSGVNQEFFVVACMIVTVLSSALETYFSPTLNNKILWMQIVGAIGFTAGGLLDHFNAFHFSVATTEWVRFSLVLAWKVSDYVLKEFKQQ